MTRHGSLAPATFATNIAGSSDQLRCADFFMAPELFAGPLRLNDGKGIPELVMCLTDAMYYALAGSSGCQRPDVSLHFPSAAYQKGEPDFRPA